MSAAVVLITKDRDVQLVASEDADVVTPLFEDWWPVPQSALDRHCLSGRFNLAPTALPLVNSIGLDRLLTWFETTRGVNVGDNRLVGDFGLKAYFGFDPDLPNGECCYVNITLLR